MIEKNYSKQTCKICGAEFPLLKSRIRRGNGKYCSKKCARMGKRTRVQKNCKLCGKPFFTIPSRMANGKGKYCSSECKWRDLEYLARLSSSIKTKFKKGQTPWNKGLTKKNSPILQLISDKVRINNPSSRPDVRIKLSQSHKGQKPWNYGRYCPQLAGENNGHWKGGHEPYYGPNWQSQKRKARKRDNTCRICGMTTSDNKRALDVHHKIAFRLFGLARYKEANDLSNLLTVCRQCHHPLEDMEVIYAEKTRVAYQC